MARRCLFCNGKDLSKEHVFGKWLLKELDIVNNNMTMTHANFALTPMNERTQSYNKLVNGNVCKKCNNGWMSQLENTCKDLIISLINLKLTDSTVDELDTNKEILAMWAFKTVLLLNYSVNYREIIPKSHFKELYKGKIPKNVIINIAFTEDDAALSWVQTNGSPIVYKNKLLDLNEFNEKKLGYKITYQLKHLLIKVVYYDLSFNTEFSDSGGMTIYPEFYLNEPFQAFKNLTQYSSSGTIYEV